MPPESADQRESLRPQPTPEQKERADLKAKARASLDELKDKVNDNLADGKYVDAVKAVGKTVETLLTSMGGGLQKAVGLLKMTNAGKQPGWLQMALDFYANHYKTKLASMTKIMNVTIDADAEIARKVPVEGLMKSIEAIAKKRHPEAKNPMDELAKELEGKPVGSVQDILAEANKLPPVTPPAAAAAAPANTPPAAPPAAPAKSA